MPVRQQQGVQGGRSNEEAGPRPRNDAPALTTCTTVAAGGGEPDPLLARGRRTKLTPVAQRAPEETRTLPDLPSCRRRHLGHTVAAARQPPHRSAHNPKSIQGDDFKKQTEPRAPSPPNKVRAFTREARGRGGGAKDLNGASKKGSGVHGRRRHGFLPVKAPHHQHHIQLQAPENQVDPDQI